MSLLARIEFSDPAFIGILIGWVMSVTLHEFAHNIVGYWGGDVSIRDEGRLTLNPLQYVDPFMTIILPMIFLLMGGIPLPGAATYINRNALRGRGWESAVSAAGPLMNLLLFAILCIPLLPGVGWIGQYQSSQTWTTAQRFVAAMCFLQIISVLLNLVPIPGLDGFGILSPFLPTDLRTKLMTPPLSSILFIGYFLLLWSAPGFFLMIVRIAAGIMGPDLFHQAWEGYASIFLSR